ncbi:hypothetical protein KUTeg_023536 [Tegillarca granosa]|uniref:Mutator-like transposase domain-containing protein n=1 Tax=Tegillarca granosa TaxID=220873 RepID=A0ABQ9E4W9_TEGGR|nr:hypothetical protein KUTeg_023536 [Tegillarca granosa]
MPPITLVKELKTNGLASVLLSQCEGYKDKFRFETSPTLPLDNSQHYDVNVRSVWVSMVTGGGVSHLNELMAKLNSPCMSQPTYSSIEQEKGDLWGDVVQEDLLAAGAEERRIAIENGNYHEGVPCISVICDDGWIKRSHKHTYNALGGGGCRHYWCRNTKTSLYWGKKLLSKAARVKIVSAVRCAIRLRSMETDKQAAVRLLQHDIHNSVHHVFGDNSRCTDFCKRRQSPDTAIFADVYTQLDGNDQVTNDENKPDIFEEIFHIWSETTSLQLQEDSRGDCNISENLTSMIIRDVTPRLLDNYTTNLAESWVSIRAKFDGGKLNNRCNRGSWHSRCYGGSLRINLGASCSTVVWEKCTSSVPGKYFQKIYQNRERALAATKKSQRKSEIRARRWKRKYQSTKDSNSKKARLEYGPDALDVVSELTPDELETKKQAFLDTHINLSH